MQRNVSATVVAVVGAPSDALARLGAPNVRAIAVDAEAPALERAATAWSEAVRTHRAYAVHDADPLAVVADAWIELYDGVGPRGDLEVASDAVRAAWRARRVELPDYYLVADPEAMPATRRHWYLGLLHEAAPHRVVPVTAGPETLLRALRQLPSGRWWPDVDRLLDGLTAAVPDRFVAASDDEHPGLALLE